MNDRRHVPKTARTLIKKWEGFEQHAYEDVVGVPTIGYGFTAPALERIGLAFPSHINQKRADRILDTLLEVHYAPRIELLTEPRLAPHQLGALCSFCYNVGIGAFRSSTLRELLNAGREEEAEQEFGRWVYAGGEVYEGLRKRRADERAYFEADEGLPVAWEDVERVPTRSVEPLDTPMDLDDLIPNRIPTDA